MSLCTCVPFASSWHLQSKSQVHMIRVHVPKTGECTYCMLPNTLSLSLSLSHTNTHTHTDRQTDRQTATAHFFSSLLSEGVTVSCWVKVRQMALTVGIQYQRPRPYDRPTTHKHKHTRTQTHALTHSTAKAPLYTRPPDGHLHR